MSTATTFLQCLADLEEDLKPETYDSGRAIVEIDTPDGPDQLVLDPGRIEPQLFAKFFQVVDRFAEQPGAGAVQLTVRLGASRYDAEASVAGMDGPVVLQFADGSTMPLGREIVRVVDEDVGVSDAVEFVTRTEDTAHVGSLGWETAAESDAAADWPVVGAQHLGTGTLFPKGEVRLKVVYVDSDEQLAEPFTVDQYASIEGILGWLWEAAAGDKLTDGQQAQIRAIAQLIEDERRDTVPNETKREVMVRFVRRGLKYIVREMPKDFLALAKLNEILNDAGWIETARDVLR